MTDQDDTLENRFKNYLSTRIPRARDINITSFIRKTEGYSYETYLVDVQWAEGNNTTYWEVLANYKGASIFISGVRAFSDGKNRDVRMISMQDSVHYFCLKELTTLLNF